MSTQVTERTGTLVIGAGQAGLSVGYHLQQHGLPFLIVDANTRIGDSWRSRWDSLRLFTPANMDGLDGMRFPAPGNTFPTKDEMGAYLEHYAATFHLPVRTNTRIDRLTHENGRFVATSGERRFEADNVVVAMSNMQKPKVPAFAGDLEPGIVQLHSRDYRNPGQLRDGSVLIVGAGNSGAEIGFELSRTHPVFLSGRPTGHLPFDLHGPPARLLPFRDDATDPLSHRCRPRPRRVPGDALGRAADPPQPQHGLRRVLRAPGGEPLLRGRRGDADARPRHRQADRAADDGERALLPRPHRHPYHQGYMELN